MRIMELHQFDQQSKKKLANAGYLNQICFLKKHIMHIKNMTQLKHGLKSPTTPQIESKFWRLSFNSKQLYGKSVFVNFFSLFNLR